MAINFLPIHYLKDVYLKAGVFLCALAMSPGSALADEPVSPLQLVMDGREAAEDSILTEEGISDGMQTLVNSTLAICGAIAVVLVGFGLYQLYIAQEEQNMMGTADDRKRAAYWKIGIGGIFSIPAIVAAILPYNLLGVAG